MKTNKTLGGILIVAGTTTGAGMLALPIVSANLGLVLSSLLMVGFWILSLISASMTVDIMLNQSKILSVPALAGRILGHGSKIFSALTLLMLLYAVLSAYISGLSSIVHSLLHQNFDRFIIAVICVITLGSILLFNIRVVDYWNRTLLTLKLFL